MSCGRCESNEESDKQKEKKKQNIHRGEHQKFLCLITVFGFFGVYVNYVSHKREKITHEYNLFYFRSMVEAKRPLQLKFGIPMGTYWK